MRVSAACFAMIVFVAPLASAQPSTEPASAAFRGSIAYSGTYSGYFAERTPRGNAREQRVSGDIGVKLVFDRGRVSGTFRSEGWLGSGELSGTVSNGVCRLTNTADGSPWTGPCGPNSFTGRVTSLPHHPMAGEVRIDATARSTEDFVANAGTMPRPTTSATGSAMAQPAGFVIRAYGPDESFQVSKGRSRQCLAYGFESDRDRRIRWISCVDVDGAWRNTDELRDPRRDAFAARWSRRSPYETIDGKTFFAAVTAPQAPIEAFLRAKGGSKPIFLPVTAHLGRDRANGDYLVPYCFSAKAGCTHASDRIDGVVTIRRSGKIGVYTVRDLGDGRQEYCVFGGGKGVCDISKLPSISLGPAGKWSRSYFEQGTVLDQDLYVITLTTNARIPEAERLALNAAGDRRFNEWQRALAESDRRSCEEYRANGGGAIC